ncbi:hypothetical protein FIBSPDRAFT_471788 [Athelia psychrophila]|uniref:Uncharacterized protein n=1 Tax=Athelia psychrophila TaxID=1759441 RepID=A0A166LB50_9AGAM|nr:hypothetical protein FIBSPDRAFT_471788 [Fibularhizoctonia sp. CBS 109695]
MSGPVLLGAIVLPKSPVLGPPTYPPTSCPTQPATPSSTPSPTRRPPAPPSLSRTPPRKFKEPADLVKVHHPPHPPIMQHRRQQKRAQHTARPPRHERHWRGAGADERAAEQLVPSRAPELRDARRSPRRAEQWRPPLPEQQDDADADEVEVVDGQLIRTSCK